MNKLIILALLVLSVISMTKGDRDDNDRDDRYLDWDVNKPISAENAIINARLRRAIHGRYNQKSNTKKIYHRQAVTHSQSTDPEGNVSTNMKRHQEKGGSAEQSKRAGAFTIGNEDNHFNGWSDNDFGTDF